MVVELGHALNPPATDALPVPAGLLFPGGGPAVVPRHGTPVSPADRLTGGAG